MLGLLLQVDPVTLWATPWVRRAVLLAATWLVIGVVVRMNDRFFDALDGHLTTVGVPERRLNALDKVVDGAFILLGVLVSLAVLGFEKAAWGAVALGSVATVVAGLATQEVGSSLVAGIVLLFERPFRVGETVQANGVTGTVETISLRTTSLVTPDGQRVSVPNRDIIGSNLTNNNAFPQRRVQVSIDVREDRDLDRVRSVLTEAIEGERHLIDGRPVHVFATEVLDEGVRFQARYWVETSAYLDHCLPSAMERLVDALGEAGIETSMPTQRVHLGSGSPVSSSDRTDDT